MLMNIFLDVENLEDQIDRVKEPYEIEENPRVRLFPMILTLLLKK